jgi:hypothetical protein
MTQLVQLPFVLVQRALAGLAGSGAAAKRRGAYAAQDAISPARAAAAPSLPAATPDTGYIGARLDAMLRTGEL